MMFRKKTAWLIAMTLLLCRIWQGAGMQALAAQNTFAAQSADWDELAVQSADRDGFAAQNADGDAADTDEAAGFQTVSVRTAQDLADLASHCILDSWSSNIRVVLENDVDLTGCSFTSIPCFSGVFDGSGRCISGLTLTKSGSHGGLFRYLTEDAVVRNLTVDGTVVPGAGSTYIGGIAGRNDGMISNCCFKGEVTAQENAGGIAGENTRTGVISDCTFSGTILGAHAVGGIAGHNTGKILNCRNKGKVNPQADVPVSSAKVNLTGDLASALENYDIASISNEDFVSIMDVGGIAGYSDGLIDNCVNTGTVGYPHTGYNVGGIAGRTLGYISRSTNRGEVRGRKDTGGIAGQIEPMTIWDYSSVQLDTLLGQLKTLDSLLSSMVADAALGVGTVRDHISVAEENTAETVRQLGKLLGETVLTFQ